jgi:hypothetical protein
VDQPNLCAMAAPFNEIKSDPIYTKVLNILEEIGLKRSNKSFELYM